MSFFAGFAHRRIRTRNADLSVLTGGSGPPLLLLHGYPQNHVMWHAVAPRLIDRFSLVIPDLRGYGESRGPAPDPRHVHYSKRAMAEDAVEIMQALGHDRFLLAGHDRGARVAYRLALDRPERIVRLAILDILPTLDVWAQMDDRAALLSYHWVFLAQPAPLPERMIGADPDYFLHHVLDRMAGRRGALDRSAVQEYERHFRKPSVIEATCEDYRAGASTDLEQDRADRHAGRRIRCPALLLWGRHYLTPKGASPLEIWRQWADDIRDTSLPCGHLVAEEQPEACAAALADFFQS